jgi:hypothetical protein
VRAEKQRDDARSIADEESPVVVTPAAVVPDALKARKADLLESLQQMQEKMSDTLGQATQLARAAQDGDTRREHGISLLEVCAALLLFFLCHY